MKILLVGTNGQVGWELQRTLMTLGEVIAVGRNTSNGLHIDLAEPETIRSVIRQVQPELIVNAAAYTAVDKAESEPDLAMAINGDAPGLMAKEAHRLGAAIVHYSTDYVFDGTKPTPYIEQDQPDPQNIYGKTKLAGEQAIQAEGVPHLILRTCWVYGARGKNFLLTMQRLGREREEIRVVDDQIGAPTDSRTIAEATAQILAQAQTTSLLADKSGIYHLSATGQTSWYGFAQAIFEREQPSHSLRLQRLIAISTEEYPTPAKRPAYSLLSTDKLSATFGLSLPNWHRALDLVLDQVNC